MGKKIEYIFIALLFGLLLFLTFNRHSKSTYKDYHSVIWGDKAGYYVYLPALFIHNFSAGSFPDSIEFKTGQGFSLDVQSGKVFTKYTYGLALLQSPFFLLAHLFSPLLNQPEDGFSPVYHWSIMVASVFYTVMGLIFFNLFLKNYFSSPVRFLLLFALLAATNFYYYAIDEVGMSHVYSFFLFSVFLFFVTEIKNGPLTFRMVSFLSIVSALIILTRPTNVFFVVFCFFLEEKTVSSTVEGIKSFLFSYKRLLAVLLGYGLIFLPQMLYWYYLTGSPFFYSYTGESFSHWNSPKLLEIWFSTLNGLFIYSPLVLFILPGFYLMFKNKPFLGVGIICLFILISYVFASWWSWNFGCAFGNRCFVEYYAVLFLPIGYFFQKIISPGTASRKILLLLIILVFSFFNLNATYHYDGCWYGGIWDYAGYWELITKGI